MGISSSTSNAHNNHSRWGMPHISNGWTLTVRQHRLVVLANNMPWLKPKYALQAQTPPRNASRCQEDTPVLLLDYAEGHGGRHFMSSHLFSTSQWRFIHTGATNLPPRCDEEFFASDHRRSWDQHRRLSLDQRWCGRRRRATGGGLEILNLVAT